jgi:hypothetical protein
MCYFITLGLPTTAENLARDEFGRGFMLLPTSNPSIRQVLPASFQALLLTSGMCSCDLYAKPGARSAERSTDGLRARYRKRGWSDAKIHRAVQASSKGRTTPVAFSGLRADIAAGVVSIVRAGVSIVWVVHWYSGDVEAESFTLNGGPRYRGPAFQAAAESLPADTLIWVDPG